MTTRTVKEWTVKAPAWDQIVDYYRDRPGRIQWLANRLPVLRGEIQETEQAAE